MARILKEISSVRIKTLRFVYNDSYIRFARKAKFDWSKVQG